MKRYVAFIIFISSLSLFLVINTGNAKAEGTDFFTGLHYEWWQSDEHDHGMQSYVPIGVNTVYKDFSFQLLSAYAYTYVNPSKASSVNPSNTSSDSLSHFTDTKLNFSYKIEKDLPVGILFGLGFNLPTGYTDLQPKDFALVVPPELMSITTYGEGFNVNPTVILYKEWDKWAAGIGLGYTWRGEYDYSFDLKDYDPGETYNVNFEVSNEITPELYGRIFGEYLEYGTDQVQGNDYYQEGDVTLLGLNARYSKAAWYVDGALRAILREKSKFRGTGSSIVGEDRNSHGDEWIADISYGYNFDKKTTLSTGLQFLMIDKNEYPKNSGLFIGNRQKTTLDVGITKVLMPDLKGSLFLKGFYMMDDKNIYHVDDLKYKGAYLTGTVSYTF